MKSYFSSLAILMLFIVNNVFAETVFTTGPYENNQSLNETLSIPNAQALIISIQGKTERNFDFLVIYDSVTGVEIVKLSGDIDNIINIRGNSILIIFKSDGRITDSGVTVTISKSLIIPPDWETYNFNHPFFGVVHVPEKERFYIVQGDDKILELQEGTDLSTVATHQIPGASSLGSITYLDGSLWVGDHRGNNKVYKLTLSTSKIDSFSISNFPDGIGTDGSYIYVVNNDQSEILNIINPSTGEKLGTLATSVPDPVGITFDGVRLLVLDESGDVYAVDKSTGNTTYLFSAPEKITTNTNNGPEGISYFDNYETIVIGYGGDNKIVFGTFPSTSSLPPVLSLQSEVLDCNLAEKAILSLNHTKGSWRVFVNGVDIGIHSEFENEYILSNNCYEHLSIQLVDPEDPTIKSNLARASWYPNGRMLTTKWNQYHIPFDYDNNGDIETFVPGCTAVAVGQLINYYFQHDYRDGWLEEFLKGVIAYPRVETENGDLIEVLFKNIAYSTDLNYIDWIDGSDEFNEAENRLVNFLIYIGIGLDAEFLLDAKGTGVKAYQGYEPYSWVTDPNTKLKSLLIDRFRFKNPSINISHISGLNQEREYIVNSIQSGHPVLLNLFGHYFPNESKKAGHTAVIDTYRVTEDGSLQVKINMGWGGSREKITYASDVWYDTTQEIEIKSSSTGTKWLVFNDFYILKNTLPITY